MKKSKKKASIIGLGKIAWSLDESLKTSFTHANAYIKNKDFELISACSLLNSDCEAFNEKHGVSVYCSINEMVEAEFPDIVSVCSPVEAHYENCVELLNLGVKRIWLEKPTCQDLEEHDLSLIHI